MKEPGLDDRHRDKDGEIQQKRGDTLNKTYRKAVSRSSRRMHGSTLCAGRQARPVSPTCRRLQRTAKPGYVLPVLLNASSKDQSQGAISANGLS